MEKKRLKSARMANQSRNLNGSENEKRARKERKTKRRKRGKNPSRGGISGKVTLSTWFQISQPNKWGKCRLNFRSKMNTTMGPAYNEEKDPKETAC